MARNVYDESEGECPRVCNQSNNESLRKEEMLTMMQDTCRGTSLSAVHRCYQKDSNPAWDL
jgi:hypothetical protein